MIKTDLALVVEGKYDRMKLEGIVDALVVTTDGFNIFRDEEKQRLIKRLAAETGIVIFTDSDEAGFRIRRFVSDICRSGRVLNAFIPDLAGKERRKQKAGKAGLLGVEGVTREIIERALRDALGAEADGADTRGADGCGADSQAELFDDGAGRGARAEAGALCGGNEVTPSDLFADGLSGTAGASERRKRLLSAAGLPTRLSTSAMCRLLTRLYGRAGYRKLCSELWAEHDI